MMFWDVHPHEGLGPLRFGMHPDAVARHRDLGPPERRAREWDGSDMEWRGLGKPKLFFADDRLRDIDTDYRVRNVRFRDLMVFEEKPKDVLRYLVTANGGSALVGLGTVTFVNIGVNIGGFYDQKVNAIVLAEGEADERGLAVFAPGAMDDLLGDKTPLDLRVLD